MPSLGADDVQLWHVSLDDRAGIAERLALLSREETARADRIRSEEDRERYTALHAATRILMGSHRDVPPEEIGIVHDAAGKPRFGDGGGPCFNISRSEGIGLIGIASTPIGVDVETIRDMDEIESVSRRYFTPREAKRIVRLRGPERRDAFLACWTRKEAFVKALGVGLSMPLSTFEVCVTAGDGAPIIVEGDGGKATAWTLWSERSGEAWAACAVESRTPRFQVHRFPDRRDAVRATNVDAP